MNRVLKYFVTTTILVLIITILISNITMATTLSDLNQPASDTFKNLGKSTVSILTSIGIVISVVILSVIGIKYLLGSVEERADYKKSLVPYFIGAAIVFGASTIANIIYKFVV